MQSLNYCQINLSNLLTNDQEYKNLLSHIQTGHICKFSDLDEQAMSKYTDAEKELWTQIRELSQNIIDASIKVVHKGPHEILQNLQDMLNKGEGKTCHSQIQYLSEPAQMRVLFGTDISSADSKLE